MVIDIVLDKLLAKLEDGIIPWRMTWAQGLPCNGISGRFYSGINAMLLSSYPDPRFYTFNQVKVVGESVKRGCQSDSCGILETV